MALKQAKRTTKISLPDEAEPQPKAAETETIGYLIRYTHRALVMALARRLEADSISPSQWSALRVLWREDGYSQVELANRLRVEKAALTSVVDALERRGLITRVRQEDDRRRLSVFLTPKGRQLSRTLAPKSAAAIKQAVAGVPEQDLANLRRTLLRIIGNCEGEEAK